MYRQKTGGLGISPFTITKSPQISDSMYAQYILMNLKNINIKYYWLQIPFCCNSHIWNWSSPW